MNWFDMVASSYPWPALCRTFLLWFSFFSIGISDSVRGPTLLDLRDLISVETSEISTTFALRSLGGLLGSMATGLLLDRLSRASRYLTLAICFSVAAFCTAFLPHAPSLCLMQVISFRMKIKILPTFAADFLLVWILQWHHPHRLKRPTYGHLVQRQLLPIHVSSSASQSRVTILPRYTLHFMFACGAFVAPLLARPFLRQVKDISSDKNKTFQR